MNLSNIAIKVAPLSNRIVLARFGKDPNVALETKDAMNDFLQSLVQYAFDGRMPEKGQAVEITFGGGDEQFTVKVTRNPSPAPNVTGRQLTACEEARKVGTADRQMLRDAVELMNLREERRLLRLALQRYGDKSRMGFVEPPALQQVIDDALSPSPAPNAVTSGQGVEVGEWDELCTRTFAIQHNPNCPSPWLVRLPGKGPIDMLPYSDALRLVKHQTGDILGFGKTLEEAARSALHPTSTGSDAQAEGE